MVFKFQHRLAATAVIAALALPVFAQQQPPVTPAAAGATAQSGHQHRAERHERHQAHMAKRMAALKDQLKLTAAQESAWTTYAAAMQPGERTARLDRKDMDKLTTPERIDRMRALRSQHAAEADRRGEATKAFYATLTPEQKKTFDAQTHHRGHPMGGMKGDREGRHGHHGKHGGDTQPQQAPAAPAK